MVEEAFDNSAVLDQSAGSNFFGDVNTRLRDVDERQMLLRDRMLLISETFVKDRDRNFEEIQSMKGLLEQLKEENKRMKEVLQRVTELLNTTVRKEELMILQRQFDLFRKVN
ncbi:MAG: hypothetical protein AABY10_03740 [Nanoarchaeota archaeon]